MSARWSRQIPHDRFRARLVAVVLLALLAGCAQLRLTPPPGQAGVPESGRPHYDAIVGQDAATIAKLRSSPAPAEPEVVQGTTPSGDEKLLIGRGFVRIGNGYDASGGVAARGWALQQGRTVGADKVLLYESASEVGLVAGYYVHYKLPFGARFRSLTPDEQRELGASGVQIGEVIGGTPASEANLQTGDFVLKFNGKTIADRAEFQQLLSDHMGKRVNLTIKRGDVTMERLVRLGALATPVAETRK